MAHSHNKLQQSPKRGHLALKSSVLAPTSTSYFGQHMILSHMNSHYKRITSAKAAVDTSAPRSMKQHIRVQDQKRRLYLNERDSEGSLSPGRRSQSVSLENLSARGSFALSRPQSSQDTRQPLDHSTPAPFSTPRDDLSAHDQYLLHQQRKQRQESSSVERTAFSPANLPRPLVSHSRWKGIQSNVRNEPFDYNSQHSRGINDDTSIQREQEFGTQTMLSPREDFVNGVQTGITSGRSSRMEYPGLSSSFGSSRMSSAYARRKKDIQTKMWEEEQMYMEFISEVTSDVLARGIFTNRVLNKVFESHIERRKEELDENRMTDMIDQLKLDLNITDG